MRRDTYLGLGGNKALVGGTRGTRASCLVVAYEYGVPPGKADLVPEKPRVACSMQVPPTNIASRVIPEKLGR
jgi:hypothetical protein